MIYPYYVGHLSGGFVEFVSPPDVRVSRFIFTFVVNDGETGEMARDAIDRVVS